MPQLGRDRPDDEAPFLFPDPRADLFAAPGFELEGPFLPLGAMEAASASAAPVAVAKSASAVASRARFAAWSDADDRRKGRNPRDQDARVVAAEAPSNVLEYPMPAANGRRVFLLQNFKVDGAALRPEHQTFLQTIAAWVKGQGAARRLQIFAEAHASRTGTAPHDDVLSRDRYLVTRAFLELQLLRAGVDATHLRVYGEGVGFRHTVFPGEDPRGRSVFVVVEPYPSTLTPVAWPPPSAPIAWPQLGFLIPGGLPPMQHVQAATALSPLPATWVGIDRGEIVKTSRGTADPAWFGLLMDHSNLRVCGAYLEGTTFPPGATTNEFTASTRAVGRQWIPNLPTLRAQGWGTMLYYFGYSIGGGQPMPPDLKAGNDAARAARGRLHAQHAKIIAGIVSPALDGAVVFFDNEDGTGTNIAPLRAYYAAFFEELQRPGPGTAKALRPGLYAHNPIASQFLAAHPEVFVLEVQLEPAHPNGAPKAWLTDRDQTFIQVRDPKDGVLKNTGTTNDAPFSPTASPLVVDATFRKLDPVRVGKAPASWVAWPVARQFRYYAGTMPAGAPLTGIPGFHGVRTWDFNSALVRDPAYPHGEPRLAAVATAAGPSIARGLFQARALPSPPQMVVDLADARQRRATTLPAGEHVEPDAPIAAAVVRGTTVGRLATILQSDNVAVCDPGTPAWTNSGSAAKVTPRRLRALALAACAADDFQAFFVGDDRAVYAMRSLRNGAWSAPVAMGLHFVAHSFAQLAATSRAVSSVDVFTIDDSGKLATVGWSLHDPDPVWPGTRSSALEAGASALFAHTAIAAVSASANKVHVFAVGTDLRLRCAELTGATWSGLRALGAVTDRVSPHARIAAHAPAATRVEVAVTTDTDQIRVHTLSGAAGAVWTETAAAVELANPATADPAAGWRINPFGDLAIATVDGSTMVWAAGVAPGAAAALRRSLAPGSRWERIQ